MQGWQQDSQTRSHVKEQLGHSSIQITVDTYGHLIPGANRAAVDRLDDAPTHPDASQAHPEPFDDTSTLAEMRELLGKSVVTLTFTSWNLINGLLARLDGLRRAA